MEVPRLSTSHPREFSQRRQLKAFMLCLGKWRVSWTFQQNAIRQNVVAFWGSCFSFSSSSCVVVVVVLVLVLVLVLVIISSIIIYAHISIVFVQSVKIKVQPSICYWFFSLALLGNKTHTIHGTNNIFTYIHEWLIFIVPMGNTFQCG